ISIALKSLFISACVQWLCFDTEFLQALENVLILTIFQLFLRYHKIGTGKPQPGCLFSCTRRLKPKTRPMPSEAR
ncbi:hypothetical protein, partial [Neisseria uirgultaei]|uniref:hypothetical protein n=1 Tax=Neisseria uirgultaei TaxID=2830646 RepID=UPI0026598158